MPGMLFAIKGFGALALATFKVIKSAISSGWPVIGH